MGEESAEVEVEAPVPASEAEQGGDVVADDLAILTADLQRLQAEYSNYRKRVERDRDLVRDVAIGGVLAELLPVLDDLDRAREHGELQGGFKAIAEQIERIVARVGLERFGAAGEAFDPMVHEALSHTTSAEVTETTAVQVFQPGYRFKERVLRPARVAVADPE
jgi:molecular chaperone GrpE